MLFFVINAIRHPVRYGRAASEAAESAAFGSGRGTEPAFGPRRATLPGLNMHIDGNMATYRPNVDQQDRPAVETIFIRDLSAGQRELRKQKSTEKVEGDDDIGVA